MSVTMPNSQAKFTVGEKLTPETLIWINTLVVALSEAQATIADHEARITALEP